MFNYLGFSVFAPWEQVKGIANSMRPRSTSFTLLSKETKEIMKV